MKILGLSTSFRVNGNTDTLIHKALESARQAGAETEFISVVGKNIRPCEGCMACQKIHRCKIQDDMQEIYPKLAEADGIILGTPVFLWTVSGMAKVIMDRTFCMRFPKLQLQNKVGGMVIAASRTGIMNAASVMDMYFRNNHMITADIVTGLGNEKGSVLQDEFAMQEAWELGRQMVALAEQGFRYPDEYDCDLNTYVRRTYGKKSSPFEQMNSERQGE